MKKTVTVQMDAALHRKLKCHAAALGVTMESIVATALAVALTRKASAK